MPEPAGLPARSARTLSLGVPGMHSIFYIIGVVVVVIVVLRLVGLA
jgi:hypothetical protein